MVSDNKRINRSPLPASISFVPPAAGLIIAGEVVKDLLLSQGFE
jgi:tRNA A37 threonylcarbamoyladenosine dehydratase